MRRKRHCRAVQVVFDGQPEVVRLYGEKPPTAKDLEAIGEVVKALRKHAAEKAALRESPVS
jgi:hypothetical protein